MANKRWNKVQKTKADIEGLINRTAWWDKKTNSWQFRTRHAMRRYFELQKSYRHQMKKLKIEVESNDEIEKNTPKKTKSSENSNGNREATGPTES